MFLVHIKKGGVVSFCYFLFNKNEIMILLKILLH